MLKNLVGTDVKPQINSEQTAKHSSFLLLVSFLLRKQLQLSSQNYHGYHCFFLFLILARIKKSPVKYHLILVLETLFISKFHILTGIQNGFGIEVNQSEVQEGNNVTALCSVNEFMHNMTNLYWTNSNSSKSAVINSTDDKKETKFNVMNFRYIASLSD